VPLAVAADDDVTLGEPGTLALALTEADAVAGCEPLCLRRQAHGGGRHPAAAHTAAARALQAHGGCARAAGTRRRRARCRHTAVARGLQAHALADCEPHCVLLAVAAPTTSRWASR